LVESSTVGGETTPSTLWSDRRPWARPEALRTYLSSSLLSVSTGPDQAAMPLLDDWIAEAGAEQVIAAVKAAVHQIEDGSTPGFTDKQELLAYLGRHASG
jgi:hypothetical protein